MEPKFLEDWTKISMAVRAACFEGNYVWTKGFEEAFAEMNGGEQITEQTLNKNRPFAVEPVPSPKKKAYVHMLLFLANGNCVEARLLNETGRILLLWAHMDDWRNRPLIMLPDKIMPKGSKSPPPKTIARGLTAGKAVVMTDTSPLTKSKAQEA